MSNTIADEEVIKNICKEIDDGLQNFRHLSNRVLDAEQMIGACGTATDLAEIACSMKKMALYLNDKDLLKCYHVFRDKIIFYAGISDENLNLIDEAIGKF